MSHGRIIAIATLAAVALAAVAPAVDAQRVTAGTPDFAPPAPPPEGTSRVTFYGYVFGYSLDSPMPANTQYPWGVADWGSSLVDPPVNCGPQGPTCDEYTFNKVGLFTTAGPVQVKETNDFSYEKLHNENGMTQDIQLDATQDVTATIHVSAAVHAWPHNENETACLGQDPPQNVPCWQNYWRWHSGVNPNFQVRAWLYAMVLGSHGQDANRAPPIESQWESKAGTLIATGETTPTNLMSLDGNGGNERVWRFDINLGKPVVDTVPREANLVLVYSFHNKMPDGTEVGISTPIRINTGEFFPTFFTIPVKNAFTVELVAPQIVHDKLVVVGVMNTPWGSYDLDPKSVTLTMTGPGGSRVDLPGLGQVGDYSVAHGGHYRPINITFIWDHREHKLPAGAYALTITASNYQGSASDSLAAFIEVDADGRLTRVEPGRAEVATFSDADFQRFVAGADSAAGKGSGDAAGLPLPLVASAPESPDALRPAPAPALAPLALALALALALRRRWNA